jgi:hypothetical protein
MWRLLYNATITILPNLYWVGGRRVRSRSVLEAVVRLYGDRACADFGVQFDKLTVRAATERLE